MKKNTAYFFLLLWVPLLIISCKSKQVATKATTLNEQIPDATTFSKEEEIQKLNETGASLNEKQTNRIIGEFALELYKAQPESTMGNFCADAIYKAAKDYNGDSIAFAILNYEGMRLERILPGEVTRYKIQELMPFENRMVFMDLSGAEVGHLIEHATQRGGWPISASIRYEIFENKPIEIRIHGELLEEQKIYKTAMPDFIANGGDGLDFLKKVETRKDTDKLIRKVFIEYILEHTFASIQVNPKIDGRIAIRNN